MKWPRPDDAPRVPVVAQVARAAGSTNGCRDWMMSDGTTHRPRGRRRCRGRDRRSAIDRNACAASFADLRRHLRQRSRDRRPGRTAACARSLRRSRGTPPVVAAARSRRRRSPDRAPTADGRASPESSMTQCRTTCLRVATRRGATATEPAEAVTRRARWRSRGAGRRSCARCRPVSRWWRTPSTGTSLAPWPRTVERDTSG